MEEHEMMREVHRLTLENNKLLKGMRRRAFWGGIVKFIIYIALFIALPLWLYVTYLAPILEQMLDTYEQIQGTRAAAEAQYGDLQTMFNQLRQFLPSAEN
ncbi:MAG TPA: hypothetical protein VJB97_00060 [Candidatus Paceibacterota bacterium]